MGCLALTILTVRCRFTDIYKFGLQILQSRKKLHTSDLSVVIKFPRSLKYLCLEKSPSGFTFQH